MIPRQIIIDLVEGDTRPPLRVRFSGLNLPTYASVKMNLARPGGLPRVSRTVTPSATDNEAGTVTWQAGDLVRGRSWAEFEFTETTGGHFTLPQRFAIIIDVRGDLG